jgi:hypothetical protein
LSRQIATMLNTIAMTYIMTSFSIGLHMLESTFWVT